MLVIFGTLFVCTWQVCVGTCGHEEDGIVQRPRVWHGWTWRRGSQEHRPWRRQVSHCS